MGAPKTVLNPATGRRVLMKGKIGKEVVAKRNKKKNNLVVKKAIKNKAIKKKTKIKMVKKTSAKKTSSKCEKRKHNTSRCMVRLINGLEGRRVTKVSVKGNIRLSAGQARRDGAQWGTVHCYDGKCKRLKQDINGRAYWG